jgi:leader peptidase (prepilin peptidase) / N-methyltransferase
MTEYDGFFSVCFFLLGSIIGSFLNVCIVRLPHEKSVVFPASHCVHCKKPIQWYDNIPLISYLILAGACRQCKKKISIRYFFVELITAVTFLLFYKYFGLTAILLPYLVMVSGFIVATFVDFEHRIIPDEVSIGGMIAGVIFSIFIPELHGQHTFWQGALWSIVGLLVGGGSIYLMGILGDVIFKKESMGGGDVKLMAMVGAFMGWKLALLTFFLAPFFGAIYGVAEKIRTKESTIAYGPFLVLGALLSLFKGEEILRWVLSNYGIPY